MLVTQDLLEQGVLEEAVKAQADFKRDGYVGTQVLIFRRDLTQTSTVEVSEAIDKPKAFREILKKMVEQERPEVVLVIYQSEVDVNYDVADPVSGLSKSPKRKLIIRIEASSPVADYELVLVYGKREDRYVYEHDVYVQSKGVRTYTRSVGECELKRDRGHNGAQRVATVIKGVLYSEGDREYLETKENPDVFVRRA